jgi:ribosomal 50S subunit-recycling heat shock protein
MRLDKFLKVSRIIKRRTIAKEVCDHDRALVNGRVAKAGTEVKIGDTVFLNLGVKKLEIKIIEVKDNVRADDAKNLYEIIKEEKVQRQEI